MPPRFRPAEGQIHPCGPSWSTPGTTGPSIQPKPRRHLPSIPWELLALALGLHSFAATPTLPITQVNQRQWLHQITLGDPGTVATASLTRTLKVAGKVLPIGTQVQGMVNEDGSGTFEWIVFANGDVCPITPLTLSPTTTGPGQESWIQCASLPTRDDAERLLGRLAEVLDEVPEIQEVPNPKDPERRIFRVRLGPFLTIAAARERTRELAPKFQAHKIKPIITSGRRLGLAPPLPK